MTPEQKIRWFAFGFMTMMGIDLVYGIVRELMRR